MASEVKEESNSTPSDVKNDALDEEMKDDNKVKDGDKDSLKNESKEESGKEASDENDDDDDDEDDDDDDEEEVALLDRPVEVTGCRARKKVERLEIISFKQKAPKETQYQEGKGKKLGECPRIEAQIVKTKGIDLIQLHRTLFNKSATINQVKKNIRKFSGFSFEKDSQDYVRKKATLEKLTLTVLRSYCSILDIERSGSKEELVERVMTFLLNPVDSGKKVLPPKKKAAKDKKKSTGKKVKSEKKKKVEKVENSEDEHAESEEEDDSTGGEASMGGTDEDNEESEEASDEEPKKKSKETKSSKVKSKADKGKKEEKKTKGTKRKHDDDSSASSTDEQPAAKKSKMPSDDEISKLVKQILESADLQEITMKKVIKQVSDAYPDFDLSHKKAFIKSTIKSVIS